MRKRLLPQSVIIFLEKRYSIAKDLMLSFIKGVKKNKTSCEKGFRGGTLGSPFFILKYAGPSLLARDKHSMWDRGSLRGIRTER